MRAENAISQARALLNYYIGRPLDSPTALAGDFERSLGAARRRRAGAEAIRRRPEMQRLRIAERSAATQLDLAKAESRMRARFHQQLWHVRPAAREPGERRIHPLERRRELHVPDLRRLQASGIVWQATANQAPRSLDREKVEQQIRLAVQQGFDELKAAAETIAAARATVSQAEKVLAMMQNNYKFGAATTLDIVDAQTAVSVARTNLLRGLHDYFVARANLRWAMGETPWE